MRQPAGLLKLSIVRDGPSDLAMAGQADFHSKQRIHDAFDELLAEGCLLVRADLTDLHYADTSAVAALVSCAMKYAEAGGQIELAGASRPVSRVLNLSGAAAFFASATDRVPVGEGRVPTAPSENYWHATEFSLPASPESAAVARARIARLVRALPLGLDECDDVVVAVGEALANAIRHGCGGNTQMQITVKCVAGPRRLAIEIADPGAGFSPDSVPSPSPRSLIQGGMGIYMMRKLMDEVSFSFGDSTIVRLVKYIPSTDASTDEPEEDLSRS